MKGEEGGRRESTRSDGEEHKEERKGSRVKYEWIREKEGSVKKGEGI
jgi:hypothetical protein